MITKWCRVIFEVGPGSCYKCGYRLRIYHRCTFFLLQLTIYFRPFLKMIAPHLCITGRGPFCRTVIITSFFWGTKLDDNFEGFPLTIVCCSGWADKVGQNLSKWRWNWVTGVGTGWGPPCMTCHYFTQPSGRISGFQFSSEFKGPSVGQIYPITAVRILFDV